MNMQRQDTGYPLFMLHHGDKSSVFPEFRNLPKIFQTNVNIIINFSYF